MHNYEMNYADKCELLILFDHLENMITVLYTCMREGREGEISDL